MITFVSLMKKFFFAIVAGCLLVACGRPAPREERQGEQRFVNEVMLKTTPVRDQGRSDLCWAYAMLGTIETEHLMLGDSVTLSTDYVARCLLREEAREAFLSGGRTTVSLRGMMPMLTDLLERYGALPFDSYYHNRGTDIYCNGVNYRVLCRKVVQVARASVSLDMLDRHVDRLLDAEVGYMPRIISMLGMEYTPLEFAHSVCLPGEYEALTSFTHHAFGTSFALELPDNRFHDTFLNVPIDTLMRRVEQSLRQGHPVCWEGDTSEPGFSFEQGVAVLPQGSGPVSQAARQRAFATRRTTDDHCMELCGVAHDRQGRKYFIAKNSWGKDNPYGGFMYLSDGYLRMKTVAVMLHRR